MFKVFFTFKINKGNINKFFLLVVFTMLPIFDNTGSYTDKICVNTDKICAANGNKAATKKKQQN